jgi:hypothetical protein
MGKVTNVSASGSQSATGRNGNVTSIQWPVKRRTLECRDCGERWIKS